MKSGKELIEAIQQTNVPTDGLAVWGYVTCSDRDVWEKKTIAISWKVNPVANEAVNEIVEKISGLTAMESV